MRGQAAVEMLMTYGWAILLTLIMLAVFSYLVVFNPQVSSPKSCILSSQLTCTDWSMDANGNLYLDLGQATGDTITVTGIGCGTNSSPAVQSITPVRIPSGGHEFITNATGVHCTGNSSGSSYHGNLVVEYTVMEMSFPKTVKGQISYPIFLQDLGPDPTLVLMLHLDNNSAIGENSTKFVDSSIYGNNGTCAGAPCPAFNASGRSGGAMQFDGTSDYITFGDVLRPDRVNNKTYSVWVNPSSQSSNTIFSTGNLYQFKAGYSVFKIQSSSQLRVSYDFNNSPYYANVNCATDLNQWNHLVFVVDISNPTNVTITAYKNGAYANQTTTPRTTSGGFNYVFLIGAETSGVGNTPSGYFKGTIDEVRIYNRSLSAAEVLSLYQSGS